MGCSMSVSTRAGIAAGNGHAANGFVAAKNYGAASGPPVIGEVAHFNAVHIGDPAFGAHAENFVFSRCGWHSA